MPTDLECYRMGQHRGVIADLKALPWNRPECVQVMLHDEDDDCFGLWIVQDGALVDVWIQRTQRVHVPPPSWWDDGPRPGSLWRTEGLDAGARPAHSPEHEQDPRLSLVARAGGAL
ncbi:hypothetical protein [Streptomyces sp. NPDC002133]|uniref:hypothetical protein n=1 Tax=Streptomyces sp. NPDC002133 TaxID=3154409 RepID=UPI0033249055